MSRRRPRRTTAAPVPTQVPRPRRLRPTNRSRRAVAAAGRLACEREPRSCGTGGRGDHPLAERRVCRHLPRSISMRSWDRCFASGSGRPPATPAVSVIEQLDADVLDARFSPDGSRLALVDPAGVRVFHTDSGRVAFLAATAFRASRSPSRRTAQMIATGGSELRDGVRPRRPRRPTPRRCRRPRPARRAEAPVPHSDRQPAWRLTPTARCSRWPTACSGQAASLEAFRPAVEFRGGRVRSTPPSRSAIATRAATSATCVSSMAWSS